MGRPHRIDYDGAWHHVMNRGAGQRPIFRDDGDRLLFEELVSSPLADAGVEVHAYCLMSNHYHLLVRSPSGALSAGMQRFGAAFTRITNARAGRDGPLFRGRFHSVLVRTDEQLMQVSRYIHRNVLDVSAAATLACYRWSSFAPYVGARPTPGWLHTSDLLDMFGGDRTAYRRFVERPDQGA